MSPPKMKLPLKINCCLCYKSVSRTNISRHFRKTHQESNPLRRMQLTHLSSIRMSGDGQHVGKGTLPPAQCSETSTNIASSEGVSTETKVSAAASTSAVSSDQCTEKDTNSTIIDASTEENVSALVSSDQSTEKDTNNSITDAPTEANISAAVSASMVSSDQCTEKDTNNTIIDASTEENVSAVVSTSVVPSDQCTEMDTNSSNIDARTEANIPAAVSAPVVFSDQDDQCLKSVQATPQTSSVVSEVLPSDAGPMDLEKETHVTIEAKSAETICSVEYSNQAVPGDKEAESTNVSTGSAPADEPNTSPSKMVQSVAGNWQTKKTAVSKTSIKSQKVYPNSSAGRGRSQTKNKDVRFEACLTSSSVRKLLVDIKNSVAKIGRDCAKMQRGPIKNTADFDRCSTGTRYKTLLRSVSLAQLVSNCNGFIALQSHQDLLFCRVCQARCEKAGYSPSCSDDQFGVFRHFMINGYGDVSKSSYKFRELRHDLWTHLNDSRHIDRLETWFMQNQANCQKDHKTSFIDAGEEILQRLKNNMYLQKNLIRIGRLSNKAADARSVASEYHVNKITSASKPTTPTVPQSAVPGTSKHVLPTVPQYAAPGASKPTALAVPQSAAPGAAKPTAPAVPQYAAPGASKHVAPTVPQSPARGALKHVAPTVPQSAARGASKHFAPTVPQSAARGALKHVVPTVPQSAAPGALKHVVPTVPQSVAADASRHVARAASKRITIIVAKPSSSKTATSAASEPAVPVSSTPAVLSASKYATIASSNSAAPVALGSAASTASKLSSPDGKLLAKTLTSLPQGCTSIRVAFEGRNVSNSASSSNLRIQSPRLAEDDSDIVSDALVVEGEDIGDSDFGIDGESIRLEEQGNHDNGESAKDPAVGESQPDLVMPTKSQERSIICCHIADGKLVGPGSIHMMNHKDDSSQSVAVSTHDELYNEVTNSPVTNTAPTKTPEVIRSCVPEEVEPGCGGTVPLVSSCPKSSAGGLALHQKTVAALDQNIQVKLEPQNQDEGLRETGPFMVLDCPETVPPEVTSSCGESAAACGSSPRSDDAVHELEELIAVVKEEPIVHEVDVHAEEASQRPEVASTEKSNSPVLTQSSLSQKALSAEHSQFSVVLTDCSRTITLPLLSKSAGGNNQHERVASYGIRKTRNFRTRRPSYVRAPSKALSIDGDDSSEPMGTRSPAKRTRSGAQTDNLSKRLKTDRNT